MLFIILIISNENKMLAQRLSSCTYLVGEIKKGATHTHTQ